MRRIYFDHNSTTPVHPEVRARMAPLLDAEFGNPSSVHETGRQARERVEQARREVAALVGGVAEEVVFCSGGTEACNLAIRGLAYWHLSRLAPAGLKFGYAPLAPKEQRDAAIKEWRKLELPPKSGEK